MDFETTDCLFVDGLAKPNESWKVNVSSQSPRMEIRPGAAISSHEGSRDHFGCRSFENFSNSDNEAAALDYGEGEGLLGDQFMLIYIWTDN